MNATWLAAIASVASAFVVGVAAIAAVVQIRHIRRANDIAIYLHLGDRLENANATQVFLSFEEFARRVQADQSLRYRLTQPHAVPEFYEIETLLRFIDNVSMLVVTRSLEERLVLNKYADDIVRLWDTLVEAIYLRRCGISNFASTFEHLAMRSKAHLDSGNLGRFYGRLQHDPRMAGFTAPPPPD